MSSDKSRFLLLYGSQTGQAQGIAEEIADRATEQGLTAELRCLGLTEKRFYLERETCAVIIVSTTGDGEPPDTVLKFMRRIRKKTLPSNYMEHLNFTLLGLGDSNYTNFCKCGKTLDARLRQLGATHFYPAGWADDATGLEIVADPWINGLWDPLRRQLNLQPGGASIENDFGNTDKTNINSDVEKIAMNNGRNSSKTDATNTQCDLAVHVENKEDTPDEKSNRNTENTSKTWEASIMSDSHASDKCVGDMTLDATGDRTKDTTGDTKKDPTGDVSLDNSIRKIDNKAVTGSLVQSLPPLSESDLSLPMCPSRYLSIIYHEDKSLDVDSLPPQNGCQFPSARADVSMATIVSASRMTHQDAVKTTLKVELDISSCDWTYEPGDSVGVLCHNNAEEVDKLLERLDVSVEQTNKVCSFSVLPETKKRNPAVPSFLGPRSTLRHALMTCCEIRAVPKKAFLRTLVEFCDDPVEKRRLQELCSKQGAGDYTKYIREPTLCLQDILAAFPSCSPPIEVVLEHLPCLQARAYSAASSPLATPGRFTFVFNIVDFPQCSGRSEPRHGVCTGWLDKLTRSLQALTPDLSTEMSQLNLSESIQIGIYPRTNLHFHAPADLAVPLILIGPGTGVAPFIGFLMHRQKLISSDTKAGETWLFFGCRHADRDFLYRTELKELQSNGVLSKLVVSFSRDDTTEQGKPRYVQDNLACHGPEVATLLCEGGATVFVCGDAKHMAKDVNDAIVSVLQTHRDMEKKDAEDFVSQLRSNKQYVEDVWT